MSTNEPQPPPASRLSPSGKPAEKTTTGGPAEQPAPARKGAEPTATARPAGKESGKAAGAPADPLRSSRASGFWATVVFLVVVLVLLAIFVLQNTDPVDIQFLGWSGRAPLAAAMMIAAAAGLVLAVAAGTLRILQLRRRVKRDRKAVGAK